MTQQRVPIQAAELAVWLSKQGQDRWWTVDGHHEVAKAIQLPNHARDLGSVLRKQSGKLFVVAPKAKGESASELLDRIAQDDDGYRVLELVWQPDPSREIPFLLIDVTRMFDVA